jgi:hypothetical protein
MAQHHSTEPVFVVEILLVKRLFLKFPWQSQMKDFVLDGSAQMNAIAPSRCRIHPSLKSPLQKMLVASFCVRPWNFLTIHLRSLLPTVFFHLQSTGANRYCSCCSCCWCCSCLPSYWCPAVERAVTLWKGCPRNHYKTMFQIPATEGLIHLMPSRARSVLVKPWADRAKSRVFDHLRYPTQQDPVYNSRTIAALEGSRSNCSRNSKLEI